MEYTSRPYSFYKVASGILSLIMLFSSGFGIVQTAIAVAFPGLLPSYLIGKAGVLPDEIIGIAGLVAGALVFKWAQKDLKCFWNYVKIWYKLKCLNTWLCQ